MVILQRVNAIHLLISILLLMHLSINVNDRIFTSIISNEEAAAEGGGLDRFNGENLSLRGNEEELCLETSKFANLVNCKICRFFHALWCSQQNASRQSKRLLIS